MWPTSGRNGGFYVKDLVSSDVYQDTITSPHDAKRVFVPSVLRPFWKRGEPRPSPHTASGNCHGSRIHANIPKKTAAASYPSAVASPPRETQAGGAESRRPRCALPGTEPREPRVTLPHRGPALTGNQHGVARSHLPHALPLPRPLTGKGGTLGREVTAGFPSPLCRRHPG